MTNPPSSTPSGASNPNNQTDTMTKKPRRFVRMFKPQFARLVETGQKLQTVRPIPKRMPVPGDLIDCREWTGKPYRSPQRKLKESEIICVGEIKVCPSSLLINNEFVPKNEFAVRDGFSCYDEMTEWFQETHGLPFTGIVIAWKP